MLHLEKLTKLYGDLRAVDEVTLTVPPGEIFGFLGPNGAGKTTTMRMIAGLIRPSSGRVLVDGIEVARDPVRALALVGYIPDQPFLYEKLTGREFLEFVAGLYRMDGREAGPRMDSLLERFEIADVADTLCQSYSHGMRQRLVMTAALLHRPRLLVVDEPMVGLDPRGARLVKGIFDELCHGEERTVFLSTHTMAVAEEICDRVGIINRGRLIATGTMKELRELAGEPGGPLESLFLKLTTGDT